MSHACLQIIHDEHSAVAAVLRSLQVVVANGPGDEAERFFDLLRAMLFYIDEFPEKRHHPKESELLFPRLAQAAPSLLPLIRKLESDHMKGQGKVRELQHLLLAWQLIGESRRTEFTHAADRYVAFSLAHMRLEEAELLPAAEAALDAEAWIELDAAFERQRDPLAGGARDPMHDALLSRIVTALPPPIGVAPAHKPAENRHEGPSSWREPHG